MENPPFLLPKESTSFPSGSRLVAALPEEIARYRRKACLACRSRKLKCDKHSPCSNCTKVFVECVFPSAVWTLPRVPKGDSTKRSRSERKGELIERVSKLEGMVGDLSELLNGAEGDAERPKRKKEMTEIGGFGVLKNQARGGGESSLRKRRKGRADEGSGEVGQDDGKDVQGGLEEEGIVEANTAEKKFGNLVVEGTRSRYISNEFWANMVDSVEDPQRIIDVDGSDSMGASLSTMETGHLPQEQRFFPFSFSSLNFRSPNPSSSQIQLLWQIYVENVDPLVKILHKPTMEKTIMKTCDGMDLEDRGMEALVFAICFAAVTSMPEEDVESRFGADKKAVETKYRIAVEQALMSAGFLNTQEIATLQAFVLFLACVRRNEDTTLVWTLTGLALRMAQSLGLHHDGTMFGLSPFETEVRRRLWWQLCYLDQRAPEDHGSGSTSWDLKFDTKMPLNINDSDLDPDITEAPSPAEGMTDTSFCLIRYEIASTSRLIRDGGRCCGLCPVKNREQTSADKERLIKECHQRLESKYLRHCDETEPIYWLVKNVARMIIAKTWFMLHDPMGRSPVTREMKDRLFLTGIQIIERSTQLETDERAKRWRWMVQAYFQFLPVAFVLAEICIRTKCDVVDRAWTAVVNTFQGWSEATAMSKNGVLLRRLMAKARRKKEENLSMRQWDLLTSAPALSTCVPRPIERQDGLENKRDAEFGAPTVVTRLAQNTIQQFPTTSYTFSADQQSTLTPWSFDESALLGGMGIADNATYWDDWNRLVRDFETGVANPDLDVSGPASERTGDWWY